MVDAGVSLSEDDLGFLEQLLKDTQYVIPLVDRHPDYQNIISRAIHLYHHISEKMLENEHQGQDRSLSLGKS